MKKKKKKPIKSRSQRVPYAIHAILPIHPIKCKPYLPYHSAYMFRASKCPFALLVVVVTLRYAIVAHAAVVVIIISLSCLAVALSPAADLQ